MERNEKLSKMIIQEMGRLRKYSEEIGKGHLLNMKNGYGSVMPKSEKVCIGCWLDSMYANRRSNTVYHIGVAEFVKKLGFVSHLEMRQYFSYRNVWPIEDEPYGVFRSSRSYGVPPYGELPLLDAISLWEECARNIMELKNEDK